MGTMQNTDGLGTAIRTVPDFPQPGVVFRDITPILADRDLLAQAVEALAQPFRGVGITKVAAIESRGFILGSPLARMLHAGFVPIRKGGKLPYHTHRVDYALEYGTDSIEMHVDAVHEGDVVLIHDDVIATGGTASASARLIRETGARVGGFSFLVELAYLSGRARLQGGAPVRSILRYDAE